MENNQRLINHKEFLILISKCNKRLRNSLISNCSTKDLYSILDCVYNATQGIVKLSPLEFKKLKKFNKTFKLLLKSNINLKRKRTILIQKGSFLQVFWFFFFLFSQ
jgi:hypothetical protein